MGKKEETLYVLKVLEKYTDKDHYLTQQQIIDKIIQDFNGPQYERKSIKTAIDILNDFNYDIEYMPKKGVALINRAIEPGEVTFLIDSVFASHVLPAKRSEDLAKRLSLLLSENYSNNYRYLRNVYNVTKTSNNEIIRSIDKIRSAIKNNVKISFKYLTYDQDGKMIHKNNGEEYIASPYYLVNSQGKYYLLAKYTGKDEKYKNDTDVTTFRIDYMQDVKKLSDGSDPIESFNKYKYGFNLADYINNRVYLFSGDVITATLKLSNPDVIRYIKDWFGNNAKISKAGNNLIAQVKGSELALYYWCLQYSSHITVQAPNSLIEKIKKNAEETINKYK